MNRYDWIDTVYVGAILRWQRGDHLVNLYADGVALQRAYGHWCVADCKLHRGSNQKGCEKVTINEYQLEALRTAGSPENPVAVKNPLLLNGVMGMCGEAGECVDLLKKFIFQEHPLDTAHLAKELGDVAWYLAISAYALGYDLETILQMNVDKLRERYPDGFDPDRSKHRKAGDV